MPHLLQQTLLKHVNLNVFVHWFTRGWNVFEGGQRRAAGLPRVSVDAGGDSQLGSELRTEKQTRRLHKHNSKSHVDTSTNGGKSRFCAFLSLRAFT